MADDDLIDYEHDETAELEAKGDEKDTKKYWPVLHFDFIRKSCGLRIVIVGDFFCSFYNWFVYFRGHYVGIHTSNFRDFILKPELLRAVIDCGFEHPSEGTTNIQQIKYAVAIGAI